MRRRVSGHRLDGKKRVMNLNRNGILRRNKPFKSDRSHALWLFRQIDVEVWLDEETGCWHWPLSISVGGLSNGGGYGKVTWNGMSMSAHRWVMEQIVGRKLPTRMHVDHAKWAGCEYRDCVNPDHLEIVTAAENIRRGNWRGTTAMRIWDRGAWCDEGHPYNKANTLMQYDRNDGWYRVCLTCHPSMKKRKKADPYARRQSNYGKAA